MSPFKQAMVIEGRRKFVASIPISISIISPSRVVARKLISGIVRVTTLSVASWHDVNINASSSIHSKHRRPIKVPLPVESRAATFYLVLKFKPYSVSLG